MVDMSFPVVGVLGYKTWRNKAGQLHRIDGPAIENPNGEKEWFRYGVWYESKEGLFNSLTEEEKAVALFSKDFLNE